MNQISKQLALKHAKLFSSQVAKQLDEINLEVSNVQITKAKKINKMILSQVHDGKIVNLYSKFNPIEEVERWVSTIESEPNHIILFGLGLGYHLQALYNKFPKVRFHIIEPNPHTVLAFFSLLDKPGFIKNIDDLIIGYREVEISSFFKRILDKFDNNWKFLHIPKYQTLYKDEYHYIMQLFKKMFIDYQSMLKSHNTFGDLWLFNALENLAMIQSTDNIMSYKQQFADKQVILVASGPSLEHHIAFLKRVSEEKKALIIAAGTSINFLVNNHIKPDFVTSYDPGEGNYKNMQPALALDVPLIFGTTIHPKIVKEYKGPKAHMIMSKDYISSYLSTINPEDIVNDAPTVTAVTLDLLYKLGVNEVFLIGQDLCFIGDQYQAKAVYPTNKSGKLLAKHKMQMEHIENNKGQLVETNKSFKVMKQYIEETVKQYENFSVVNLSLYGAKIEGIPYKNADLVENELSTLDKQEEIISSFRSRSLNRQDFNETIKNFKKVFLLHEEQLDRIYKQLNKFDSRKQTTAFFAEIQQRLQMLFEQKAYQYLINPIVVNESHQLSRTIANSDLSTSDSIKRYLEEAVEPLVNAISKTIITYQYKLNHIKDLNQSAEISINSNNKKFLNHYLNDKSKSAVIDFTERNDRLVIVFSGLFGGLGMPINAFFGEVFSGYKIVFLRDLKQSAFQSGLKGISDIDESNKMSYYLKKLIKRSNAKKIILAGASTGGYAAIRYGLNLKEVNQIIAFAPPTFLDERNKKTYDDNRWQEELEINIMEELPDLKVLLTNKEKKLIDIYYAEDNELDQFHASRLEGHDNIHLHRLKQGGHRVLEELFIQKQLDRIKNSLLKDIGDHFEFISK
ncbi:hypothetical protein J2T56_001555 [Natronobacillus azotifigens]|uniref:DUF115 domain-containing protein n=1 Tax=Natronobacillus azotifigens TaxID=472978 RepID=A0A9J6R986_9BACI|nr:6-hydroxymethylpterin diphosphokinase MptE-like protein [Natronobacillus azotifigens]MCZ0702111.1 DUF115 domain-containing protein [Natronobacillus azotifigens]